MNPNDPAGGSTFRPDALAPLVDQPVVHSTSSDKIRLSILATALVDALGGPVEFHKRGTFPFTTSFIPNTNFSRYGVLAPGTWTDDSSMALCLARSIARYGFDEGRQLEAYWKWFAEGEMSAIGKCFDIGGTTFTALDLYDQEKGRGQPTPAILQHLRDALSAPRNGGNGSLMRVLPVGLAYWRDVENAKVYAKRSSETTHPAPLPTETCEVWTAIIATIMQNAVVPEGSGEAPTASAQRYSKLDLLDFISKYPYNNEDLHKHLTVPVSAPPPQFIHDADKYTQEVYYWHHHPILRLISKTASQQSNRQKPHYTARQRFAFYSGMEDSE
ncbi:ADP-ribosylglycohydrolase [Coprinellus micaceus]|uniref:ADP-ribosylhydrolase ARH3 n=1 Tax=Coprinellus micaceus TaxID=71717 RepID=A0A4Y7SXJ5_COPMI|nr:ADP-ribosylglycohydrolase [Coprinellus micaceus]